MSAAAPPTPHLEAETKADAAVLFVHGVGSQKPGASLLQFGDPYVAFVSDWIASRGGAVRVESRVRDSPAHARIFVSSGGVERQILLAECCWSESYLPPSTKTALSFIIQLAPRLATGIVRSLSELFRSMKGYLPEGVRRPYSFVTGITGTALALLVFCGVVAVALILVPVLLIGKFVPPIHRQVAKLLAVLAEPTGDTWSFVQSHIRAGQMVEKVADDIDWTTARAKRATIVAHSQGSALVLRALTDKWHPEVRFFATLGAAINLLEVESDPPASRIRKLLRHRDFVWLNFYAGFDLVPSGRLAEEQLDRLHEYPVVNLASVVRDHFAYFNNQEQVIAPIAIKSLVIAGVEIATRPEIAALEAAGDRRNWRGLYLLVAKLLFLLGATALAVWAYVGNSDKYLDVLAASLVRLLSDPAEDFIQGRSWIARFVILATVDILLIAIVQTLMGVAWQRWNASTFRRLVRTTVDMDASSDELARRAVRTASPPREWVRKRVRKLVPLVTGGSEAAPSPYSV